MMSATPIPRTLAMSYYADLDVSVIDELPPGRNAGRDQARSPRRAATRCSRASATPARDGQPGLLGLPADRGIAKELRRCRPALRGRTQALQPQTSARHCAIGLVHGRLAPAEKAAVMAGVHARRRSQLLVATTVIEVGVDVPNASLMVIEHAERFGLAQLHQLRGRVGRGARRQRLHSALPEAAVANARARG